MVRVNIVLDKRYRMKNECYPIKIRVTRKGYTFYINTDITVKEEEWDKAAQKVVKRRDKSTLNYRLQGRLTTIQTEISTLQLNGELRAYTNKRLQLYLSGDNDRKDNQALFLSQYNNFLLQKENPRTVQIYEASKKHIEAYCDIENLYLQDIDINWIEEFARYLKAHGCVSANTRAIHLRNIRAILNFAYKRKIIDDYVFAQYKIEKEDTAKRSLSIGSLRLLYTAELGKRKAMYRDIFFLLFFLMGINIVDLSRLDSITNGRIIYRRAKTGTVYDIKVEPEAMAIIERYKGQTHLLDIFDRYKNYNDFKGRFNKNLKEICKGLKIDANISSYWARHTFATIAYEIGIPMDIIADCLGHKSAQNRITQIYVRKDQKQVDEANRRVIDYVLYDKV